MEGNGAAVLQDRLNDPGTTAVLNRLLDRIEALEQAVTTLTDTVQQAPGMVAMMTDIVDETYREAQASGTDVEQQLQGGLGMGGGGAVGAPPPSDELGLPSDSDDSDEGSDSEDDVPELVENFDEAQK